MTVQAEAATIFGAVVHVVLIHHHVAKLQDGSRGGDVSTSLIWRGSS